MERILDLHIAQTFGVLAVTLFQVRVGPQPGNLPEGHRDIVPRAGTFVAFRSDTVYHEVLPATDFRFSITAWFRRRSLF